MANVPISNMTTTWTDSGTTYSGVKLNVTDTASASGSLLMDLQVGGATQFNVAKNGSIVANGFIKGKGSTGTVIFDGVSGYFVSTSLIGGLRWGVAGASSISSFDLILARDDAGILAQRNGTNAQTFRIYNTTDAGIANYERGFLKWDSNILKIGTEKGGTGTQRAVEIDAGVYINLNLAGANKFGIGGSENVCYQNLSISDTKNIVFGTTTGTKIGTATSQKLAFWNATPIVQPTTGIAEATFVENSGGTAVNVDSTFDGYTLQQIAKALRDAGLLA